MITATSKSIHAAFRQHADVDTVLSFTKRPSKPLTGSPPNDRVDSKEMELVQVKHRIFDARPIANSFSIDIQGFQLAQHESRYVHERDIELLRENYLNEMAQFVKEKLNADFVLPRRKGFYLRNAGKQVAPGQSLPAGFVHIDYAPSAGKILAETENSLQGLPNRTYSRLMVIQAWRAVSPPPQDLPLSLCDGQTVRDEDTVENDGVVGPKEELGNTFRSLRVYHNPEQKWYYFSNMTANEVILFKSYDSETSLYRKVPHSAFDNRSCFPNPIPRESMEARFFVYFD